MAGTFGPVKTTHNASASISVNAGLPNVVQPSGVNIFVEWIAAYYEGVIAGVTPGFALRVNIDSAFGSVGTLFNAPLVVTSGTNHAGLLFVSNIGIMIPRDGAVHITAQAIGQQDTATAVTDTSPFIRLSTGFREVTGAV